MLVRWRRYLRRHPRAVDVAVAVGPVFFAFPGVNVSVNGAPVPETWPGYLLAGGACAALGWARRYPSSCLIAVVACTTAMAAIGFTMTPLLLAPAMVALFFTALLNEPATSAAWTAGTITVLVTAAVAASPPGVPLALETIDLGAWLILPLPLGIMARARLASIDAATRRAEHAEQTREDEARRRVAEERMRIARDLHDVVAHHLAVANAQAGTAAHLLHTNPDKTEELLAELTVTTSSALQELKSTVGLLRQDKDDDSPHQPAPGLALLPDLSASLRSAGLEVTVTFTGEIKALPAAIDLTAYRIIQEALTNAAKHAASNTAQVEVAFTATALRITVTNQAHHSPAVDTDAVGYGLIGMRERAQSVGGRLRAGQGPDGYFEVTAELPLPSRQTHAHTSQ
jgi:signal transduction histidine kinase